MNEEWYNDQIRLMKDKNWVKLNDIVSYKLLLISYSDPTTMLG